MSGYLDSYYAASRHGDAPGQPLAGDSTVDVAVIGGGLTGLNAALELARRGLSTCVIEQHEIGWGASGRSGGQVIAGLGVDMPPLERALGRDTARALFDLALEGMTELRGRIHRHGIRCDLVDGHLVAAHNRREAEALRREAAHLAEVYDYPVRYLDRDALSAQVVSARYAGGLYDANSGHLHPLNYTLAVADLAHQAGVALHARSPVERIDGDGPCRVHGAGWTVRCERVLLCTNAYLGRLAPALSRHFMPVGSHIVATRPLGEELARQLLPGNAAVSDTRRILDYYRMSADHRLLFGGRVGLFDPSVLQLMAVMGQRIARVFPALAGVEMDYAWGGHVAVTRSHAPRLGRRGAMLYAHGYSGHGMVLSGIAGKLLAEAAAGEDARFDLATRIPNPAIPLPRFAFRPALALLLGWFRLRDRL